MNRPVAPPIRARIITCPAVWPCVGSTVSVSSRQYPSSTRPDSPASTIGSTLFWITLPPMAGTPSPVQMLELAPAEQIFGTRKGRYPASVVKPRVPADVVDMEMGAHHEV